MKINKMNKNKLVILIAAVVVFLATSVFASMMYLKNQDSSRSKNVPTVNYNKPTKDQVTGTQNPSTDSRLGTSTKPTNTDSAPVASGNSSTSNQVQVTITANGINGSTYQLRAMIGAVVPDGTCTLTLTKGSTVVTKTASIQNQASISTCAGFNIPLSELGSGQWNVDLNVKTSQLTGHAASVITVP